MTHQLKRRSVILGMGAASALSACGAGGMGGAGQGTSGAAKIDARVQSTLNHMFFEYPGTRTLADNAAGMLVMPLLTEVGFGFGGSYGRGAFLQRGQTVDYYSAASASAGFQIGAKQYSHVLFFMSDTAVSDFRRSSGWAAGANIEYAITSDGQTLATDTTTLLSPVVAVIFAQAGFHVGATLEGIKYTRIAPR